MKALSKSSHDYVNMKMEQAYYEGKKAGRAEAQRFFRLALGVEIPSYEEAAHWNNPVPLKETDDDREY